MIWPFVFSFFSISWDLISFFSISSFLISFFTIVSFSSLTSDPSRVAKILPSDTLSPILTFSSEILPSKGEGTSTLDLSLSNVTIGSFFFNYFSEYQFLHALHLLYIYRLFLTTVVSIVERKWLWYNVGLINNAFEVEKGRGPIRHLDHYDMSYYVIILGWV